MKGECLVTIITPVFNGEKYLDRYFENIDKLTYKNPPGHCGERWKCGCFV